MIIVAIIGTILLVAMGVVMAMCNPWKVFLNPPAPPKVDPAPDMSKEHRNFLENNRRSFARLMGDLGCILENGRDK